MILLLAPCTLPSLLMLQLLSFYFSLLSLAFVRRSLIIILLLGFLAGTGYFLIKGKETILADPYSAIPDNACIIIETVDIRSFVNSLTAGKGLFSEMGKIRQLRPFYSQLKFTAEKINGASFNDLFTDGRALISWHPSAEGRMKSLLSLPLSSRFNYHDLRQILTSSGFPDVNETHSDGLRYLWFRATRPADTTFIVLNSGLLLMADSRKLIQKSVMTLSEESDIRSHPGFKRILLSSGKNEDKIFLVFENLSSVINKMFANETQGKSGDFLKTAVAGSGDIYQNDNGLVLSGYMETKDSSGLLGRVKSVTPVEMQTYRVLPANTALFETVIYNERQQWKTDSLRSYVGDEITRAYVDAKDSEEDLKTMIIYELKDPVRAEQIFVGQAGDSSSVMWYEPDEQVRIPVYNLHHGGFVNSFVPEFGSFHGDSLFTFYNNFMITGSSFSTLSRMLYDNILNNTLAYNINYRDFENSLPGRSGYFFFCIPSKIIKRAEGFLNDSIIASMEENRISLGRISAAGFRLASSNDMLYSSTSIRYQDDVADKSITEWETLLDTTAAIKPLFFTNHLTGAREIFVQDLKKNIYLINAAGRVLWKVPLQEKIEGSVYMIDYYRNGKYQLLFNGRNYLHLIDRNGNYVERYPVKLRSPSTNSLALLDYDNNKNYRLLIAGEDRQVYAYDRAGSIVKGWNLFRTASTVRTQICHFQISGKDYIAVSDENSLYLLDRSGNRRISFREQVSRAPGSALKLTAGSDPYLVCTSGEGTVQHIYPDGRVKKYSINQFTTGHFFDIFDINADGFDEYIFIDKGVLYLYDHNRSELFHKDFGSDNLEGPITFSFSSNNRKIGIFDRGKNLIYLIDSKGKLMKGFPLKGASLFSIGKIADRNNWNLIVAGPGRFLYNYRIDTGEI